MEKSDSRKLLNHRYYNKIKNIKDKDKDKEKENEYTGIAKFNFLKNKLFNEKKSSSLFNINFYNNFSKKKKDNNNEEGNGEEQQGDNDE